MGEQQQDSVFPRNLEGYMGPGSHGTAVGLLHTYLAGAQLCPQGAVFDDHYGPNLTQGVRNLQQILYGAGATHLDIDGCFGSATRKAWVEHSGSDRVPVFSLDMFPLQDGDHTHWVDHQMGSGDWPEAA